MTKIRNTKKGMAKKTLSISLAVAMLATSNVPVWAAEDLFTDGEVAVEAFTADEVVEEEAPVVEEEVVEEATEAVTTSDDFTVSLTDVKYAGEAIKDNTVTWGSRLTANLEVKDNEVVTGADLKAVWKLNGEVVEKTETPLTAGTVLPCARDIVAADAGKKLELFVYAEKDGSRVWSYTSEAITINAKDISELVDGFTFENEENPVVYDGTEQRPWCWGIELKDGVTDTKLQDYAKYDVAYTGDLVNVTDAGVTVTIKPKEDLLVGYTGTVTGSYKIQPKELSTDAETAEVMKATLVNTTYAFTGNTTSKVKASDIKLEDVSTKADLSGYLAVDKYGYVAVTFTETAAGSMEPVTVGLINGQPETGLKNYNITDETPQIKTANDMTIVARELSTVVASVPDQKYTGEKVVIDPKTVTFKDATTLETLNLGDVDVKVQDNAIERGTGYVATITPGKGNHNITGSVTGKFNIFSENIADANFGDPDTGTDTDFTGKYYTGEDVTFTADELGVLWKDGKKVEQKDYEVSYFNNKNAGTAQLIVTGKNSYLGSQKVINFQIAAATVSSITANEAVEIMDVSAAKDYKEAMNVVVKATNPGKKQFTLVEGENYTVEYEFYKAKENDATTAPKEGNVVDGQVIARVTITDPNFKGTTTVAMTAESDIVAAILKAEYIKLRENDFTYTGKAISPKFDVLIGGKTINPKYYNASYTNNVNAGTATLKVTGNGTNYSGTATVEYTIKPAAAEDLKGVIATKEYKGYSLEVAPDEIDLTLNGVKIDVADNFTLTYGENLNIGEGTVTLTPKNDNFKGTKTLTFQISAELLEGSGTFKYLDKDGFDVTAKAADGTLFTYDGTEKTFAKVNFAYTKATDEDVTLTEGKDYELKYVDNVYGKESEAGQLGAVLAIAKGKYGHAGTYTDAEGNKYTNVIAVGTFKITQQNVNNSNISVSNGTYAAGLPTKPEVSIVVKGVTLVEGKDYDLDLTANKDIVNATTAKTLNVIVNFKNGYKYNGTSFSAKWGIDKFDLANAEVSVKDEKLVVKCGRVDIEASEYTATVNEDGTTTITANKDSKNYTGTKTVNFKAEAQKPAAPMITAVNVTGNKATVILSGDSEGAVGYDYVISTNRNCIVDKDYAKVNKNKLTTNTTFTYVQQDVYYAYCHAWKRDENGKKIFSDWSNPYPFAVSAITPEKPAITDYKVNGNTVTVTYTKAANADGYDVVLGTTYGTVADERRPLQYGELVKKNIKGNTVTATFKNVPKGTYYAGLHAFNRTSEDGKKVFSPWSDIKTIKVK